MAAQFGPLDQKVDPDHARPNSLLPQPQAEPGGLLPSLAEPVFRCLVQQSSQSAVLHREKVAVDVDIPFYAASAVGIMR